MGLFSKTAPKTASRIESLVPAGSLVPAETLVSAGVAVLPQLTAAELIREIGSPVAGLVRADVLDHNTRLERVTGLPRRVHTWGSAPIDTHDYFLKDTSTEGADEKAWRLKFTEKFLAYLWTTNGALLKFPFAASVTVQGGVMVAKPPDPSRSWVDYEHLGYVGDIPDFALDRIATTGRDLRQFTLHSLHLLSTRPFAKIDPVLVGWRDDPGFIQSDGRVVLRDRQLLVSGVVLAVWDNDKELEVL